MDTITYGISEQLFKTHCFPFILYADEAIALARSFAKSAG